MTFFTPERGQLKGLAKGARRSRQRFVNQIPSDAILVEARLAEQIGASRTPIREALHFLEKEGLLEALPRVGYRVRKINWQEVEEVVEIRKGSKALRQDGPLSGLKVNRSRS